MPGNPQATIDSNPSILGSFELIFYSFNRHIPSPSPAAHAPGGTAWQSAAKPERMEGSGQGLCQVGGSDSTPDPGPAAGEAASQRVVS